MKHIERNICMTIKYMLAVILTIWAFISIAKIQYIFLALIELSIIFVITNIFAHKRIGNVINFVFMLLYNVQMTVLAFSNTYITLVMLTNFESIEMLAGKAWIYITAAVFVLIASFLPVRKITVPKKMQVIFLSSAFVVYAFLFSIIGSAYSPMSGYIQLASQQYNAVKLSHEIEQMLANLENAEYISEFYNEEIENHYSKNAGLPQKPNIILIFTEGLSQNVISDERNIMPNVKAYQEKSLNFINYYNHTFATYRGLIGQLYSGYQNNNHDSNPLISLQGILRNEGYHTTFLNSEPRNKEFTRYLSDFYFDELVGDTNWNHSGMGNTMSDKDMYTLLYEEAEKQAASDRPFFLATYTVGTHVSFDSLDIKYETGTDAELNKFYETDYYFGEFMKKFEESSFADNTVIIFTTDHATFRDDSFRNAFPNYTRSVSSLDEIPFFIYHKNVESKTIDVDGRNSICFAPTILDYLDISAENYFLGSSLFSKRTDSWRETIYTDSNMFFSTDNDKIVNLGKTQQNSFQTLLKTYYVTKEAATKGTYYYPIDDERKTDRYMTPAGYYYWAGLPVNNTWVKNGTDSDLNAWYHTNETGHFVTDPTGKHVIQITIDGVNYEAIRIEFDGVVYTFDNTNGKLLLGDIVNDNGTLYYYWAGKPLNSGWFKVNGSTYYAYEDGHLALGEERINGLSYTFAMDGVNDAQLQYGALKEQDGKWYCYWAEDLLKDTFVKVKDNYYYATSDGSFATGWLEFGNNIYYAYSDGHFATGSAQIENKIYDFTKEGVLLDLWLYKTVPVYRLFNGRSIEHIYTMSIEERNTLLSAGWQNEEIAWYAPEIQGNPVYRLYNAANVMHFYTMHQEEIEELTSAGWSVEGIAFYSAPSKGEPIYRLYYPKLQTGVHHFTGNEQERDELIKQGWIYEGIGWYGTLQ